MTRNEATNYVRENMEGNFYLTDERGTTDGEIFTAEETLSIISEMTDDEWNNAGVVLN